MTETNSEQPELSQSAATLVEVVKVLGKLKNDEERERVLRSAAMWYGYNVATVREWGRR